MARLNAANNAQTRLQGDITDSTTSFYVVDASVFPDIPFLISIDNEIMLVKNISTNLLMVDRGQENTIAATHTENSLVENRFTAGMYEGLASLEDIGGETPFKIKSAFYAEMDAVISVLIASGTGETFSGNTINTITKTSDTTFNITSPLASTTYTIYLKNDGNFAWSIDGSITDGSIIIGTILTNADKSVNTIVDKRPLVSGVGNELILHKAEEATQTIHSKAVSKSYDVHVSKTGNDDTGDGTENNPFLTIQKAVNSVPKNLNGYKVTIRVSPGTYDENVVMASFYGGQIIILGGNSLETAANYKVDKVLVQECRSVRIVGFTITENIVEEVYQYGVLCIDVSSLSCEYLLIEKEESRAYGGMNFMRVPVAILSFIKISNKGFAIHAIQGSTVFLKEVSGTNNTIALQAGSGYGSLAGIIYKGVNVTISGTEVKEYGGQIYGS